MPENKNQTIIGVIYALSAYLMWGVFPLYFKFMARIPPLEILAHRVIWSFILLFFSVLFFKKHYNLKQVLCHKKTAVMLFCSATIIANNWLVFIWAVINNHLLDASLGYYINPLVNVLLGMIFLGERLSKMQWLAVFLAIIGVSVQLISFGKIPLTAIFLALSFGSYGLIRKKVKVAAVPGLLAETGLLFPIALIYLLSCIDNSNTANMLNNNLSLNLSLMAAGLITTLPLLCFTAAAIRLRLSTLGFFQYIGPSVMFFIALFIFNEPFSAPSALSFLFIWSALAVFSADGLRKAKLK